MGSKVALWNQLSRYVVIDPTATKGAQVGVNLLAPDGSLVKWGDILNVGTGTTGTLDTTDDLDEGTFNFYFTADRFYGALKTDLVGSSNVSVTFDDSGQTATVDLTPISGTVGGTLSKWGFDAYGRRVSGDNASTSDLPEGTNLYYTDARADARITLQKGQPNGLATLDGGGLVPVAQLPPIAITDTFVVSSQAAMLALTAQTGDVCIRTDLNETFILAANPASTLANWKQMLFPTSGVTSVFGRTGAVTAQTGDYAVAQVTGAAPLANPVFTGDPQAPTPASSDNDTSIATTAFVKSIGYLTAAPIDGKTYAQKNGLYQAIAAALATSTGFQIGNVLVQTGNDSAPIPSSANVTTKAVIFPTAYTTLLYVHAIPTVASVTSSGFNAVSASTGKSGTGFTAHFDSDSGGVSGAFINKVINFDWVAIGILPAVGTLALTGTFPGAVIGVPYSQSIAISGGVSPYALTGGTGLISGTLPAGLSLSVVGSTLVLSGTPTTLGSSSFTVGVVSTDAQSATSPQTVGVTVLSPVLDLLSVSSSVAFSLRLLRSAYSGPSIKVRNNTTNALQDIGFDGSGNLDTAALSTFLGSADGYVETCYDQSGHGLNVTASGATRPRIALAGVIDRLNGVPTMVFNGSNFLTNAAGAITSTSGWTGNAVAKPTVNSGFQAVFDQDTLPSTRIAQYIRTSSGGYQTIAFNTAVTSFSTTTLLTNPTVISAICSASLITAYGDGTAGSTPVTFTGTIATGAIAFAIGKSLVTSSPNWFTGKISEVTGFPSALSTADRHLLERNQGTYYGVTVA